MYNGEIISYEISKQPTLEPILKALEKAIKITGINKEERIFHSDQGWAYKIKQYTSRLESEEITQSMSRKGNCLDNSPMENFFGILKQEIYYRNKFYSYEELKEIIEKYIAYYNKDRIKEKLGYLSPVEYREKNVA
ncbi:IS3 family transposase [Peptoniphilus sp. HMSC075B08]|uniref:IS3 family transposase n=1 Tax=Peptoniphilus sp. HMSC075B08 TaxID=1739525 RepID=UPI0009F53ED6|nr:IS3 family transposase [Peptoniphilus sp. HMSC075B08]